MKRLSSLLLLFALVLTLVCCNSAPIEDEVVTTDAVVAEDFIYEHVIIVGIDGMGAFNTKADTPNIDKIFADGALTNVARTASPTATGPCWLSSFTGVQAQDEMGLTANPGTSLTFDKRFASALEKYPTIFTMTHDKYENAKIASLVSWDPLNEHCVNDEKYVYKKEFGGNDLSLKTAAVEYIVNEKPTLLFVHFESVDSAGHKIGYETEDYLKQLSVVDGYFGEIYDAIEKADILDSTLIILATDHGGTGTVHGASKEDAVLNITLAFKGKNIAPIKDFEANLRDIAAIVAEALDLKPSAAWAKVSEPARLPEGLFIK